MVSEFSGRRASNQAEDSVWVFQQMKQLRQVIRAARALGRHRRLEEVVLELEHQIGKLLPTRTQAIYFQEASTEGAAGGAFVHYGEQTAFPPQLPRALVQRLEQDFFRAIHLVPDTEMVFPLVSTGRLLGACWVRLLSPCGEEALDGMENLLELGSMAIANNLHRQQWEQQQGMLVDYQLEEIRRTQAKIYQLRVLNEASSALGRHLKIDDVYQVLLEQVPRLLPVETMAIYQSPRRGSFVHVAGDPTLGRELPGGLAQLTEQFGRILKSYRLKPEELRELEVDDSGFSYLMPLGSGGNLLGVVFLRFAHNPADAMDAIENLHGLAALALMNGQLYAQSEQRAITDALTGVYNRRFFNERLIAEMQRADRYRRDFGLIMFDIDFFKACNDQLGHLVGDQLLRMVSRVIQQNLRLTDVVARYGGEEFAAICPETDLEGTRTVAERIRNAVEEVRFQGVEQLPMGKVTVSGGVTAFWPGCGVDELIGAADRALYTAKQGGRNRICLWADASSVSP